MFIENSIYFRINELQNGSMEEAFGDAPYEGEGGHKHSEENTRTCPFIG